MIADHNRRCVVPSVAKRAAFLTRVYRQGATIEQLDQQVQHAVDEYNKHCGTVKDMKALAHVRLVPVSVISQTDVPNHLS